MLIVALVLSWAGITAQSEMEKRFQTATSKGRALLWSSFIKNDIQHDIFSKQEKAVESISHDKKQLFDLIDEQKN